MLVPGQLLPWSWTPVEVMSRWPTDVPLLMLHSGRPHPRWSRWSILTAPQGYYRFHQTDTACPASSHPSGRSELHFTQPHPLPESLEAIQHQLNHRPFADLRRIYRATPADALWLGYLSYDLGRWIEHLPAQALRDREWPMIELAYCPAYLLFDNQTHHWHLAGAPQSLQPLLERIACAKPIKPVATQITPARSVFDPVDYRRAIARSIGYIAAGDIFQVNLAQRFTAGFQGSFPLAQRQLYRQLHDVSPAWYGAYLELTSDATQPRVMASTSPELFLEVDSQGHVITRPIKGTLPAHQNAQLLRDSLKDTAELNMIVDLLRNDLGRVCEYNTVHVTEPRTIETHPTIHHGVATITGQLHPRHNLIDLLRATLPGGSITGAPKIRAMQIIDELEPVQRGPYCGSIGYLSHQHSCFNIAIRTMLIDVNQHRVDFSTGGGIVADSDPQQEYDETLAKAQAILRALNTHIA